MRDEGVGSWEEVMCMMLMIGYEGGMSIHLCCFIFGFHDRCHFFGCCRRRCMLHVAMDTFRTNQASWDSILPAPLRSTLPPSSRALMTLVHKVDYIVIRSQIARRITASVSADMAEAVDMRKSGKLPEVLLYSALL